MWSQALGLGLLFLTPTWASPMPAESAGHASMTHPLVKRAEPSHYPGGDTTEYTNEPLYLNFDMNKPEDKFKVQKLHYNFGIEWARLMLAAWQIANPDIEPDRTIFKRFFIDDDEERGYVTGVVDTLFDVNTLVAKELTKTFIIDNNDWAQRCPESQNPCSDCDANLAGAYTGIDVDGDKREKTHFCLNAYTFSNQEDIKCDTLDDHPDIRMENLARIMFHVFLHYSTVGPATDLGEKIIDELNRDGLHAYLPSRCHGLVAQDGPGYVSKPSSNADSYAWLAQNYWFKGWCTYWGETPANNGNFNDPPPYKPGHPGDPEE